MDDLSPFSNFLNELNTVNDLSSLHIDVESYPLASELKKRVMMIEEWRDKNHKMNGPYSIELYVIIIVDLFFI